MPKKGKSSKASGSNVKRPINTRQVVLTGYKQLIRCLAVQQNDFYSVRFGISMVISKFDAILNYSHQFDVVSLADVDADFLYTDSKEMLQRSLLIKIHSLYEETIQKLISLDEVAIEQLRKCKQNIKSISFCLLSLKACDINSQELYSLQHLSNFLSDTMDILSSLQQLVIASKLLLDHYMRSHSVDLESSELSDLMSVWSERNQRFDDQEQRIGASFYAFYVITALQDRSLLVQTDNLRNVISAGMLCLLAPLLSIHSWSTFMQHDSSTKFMVNSVRDLVIGSFFVYCRSSIKNSYQGVCSGSRNYNNAGVIGVFQSYLTSAMDQAQQFLHSNAGQRRGSLRGVMSCQSMETVVEFCSYLAVLWAISSILLFIRSNMK
ncbi:hypothetical protein MIR68_002418 [Amoeboaphelidium protococcarum]|nr:hypothetical protein MIR68_002418 [Amoeboaphelidium protococcarum]